MPFAALCDVNDVRAWQELADVCGPGGRAALESPWAIAVPAGWTVTRLLMMVVEAAIRAEGHRAFLHVLHENTRAIELYRRLGFDTRADMMITAVRHTEPGT